MIENNKKYQIILVLSPVLEPEKLEKTIEKAKQLIINQEGSFLEKDNNQSAQLKKLSYPINKHKEAFYLTLNFSLPTKNVETLNQELNMDKNIIRQIITTQDKTKIPAKEKVDYSKMIEKIEPLLEEKIPKISDTSEKKVSTLSKSKDKPTEKTAKAEIKDLDKKLEEILNK